MSYPQRRETPAKSERELIGDRVAQGRALSGRRTQETFATAMTVRTGRRWTKSKVSDIERGEAPLHAEDLKAIAAEQGLSYEWYLDGTLGNLAPRSSDPRSINGTALADVIPIRRGRRTHTPAVAYA